MPAPALRAAGNGRNAAINSEDTSTDEIRVYRDEVGESSETVCDRSSSQREIREEHRTLVEREEAVDHRDERTTFPKGPDRSRSSNGDNYRPYDGQFYGRHHNAHAAFAQNFFGLQNSMGAFSGFPLVPSPVGSSMQIPGPKMAPSPIAKSPMPSSTAFLGHNGTLPPAHMGLGRGGFSPFGAGFSHPHFPMPVYTPEMQNALAASYNMMQHNAMLDMFNRGNMLSPGFRPNSPFPTMAPSSPYHPFMMNSPGHPSMMPGVFPHHHFMPQSPDANGRFSGNGQVSSSRLSHSSASSTTSSTKDHSENRFGRSSKKDKMCHVKKPLNAFMLYMKEQRASVQAECTLKESAAINQILGKKWHALNRTEQTKYYDMAKAERENHAKIYPGWTAKDNYAQCGKKKRRKKEKSDEPKKCRAIFGIERQAEWCKPCRRKKKCIRYSQNGTLLPTAGGDYHDPKSSSESVSCVSSSMQVLSPSADSAASSTSPSSTAASTG